MAEMKAVYTQYSELKQVLGEFQEQSLISLDRIFQAAGSGSLTEKEIQELNLDLLGVLQGEMSIGLKYWESQGDNHLVVTSYKCILINLYGARVLLSGWEFFEGDIIVQNIRWMEKDHLILLSFFYPSREEHMKCVCHFSNDGDEFVLLGPTEKADNIIKIDQPTGDEDLSDCGGWDSVEW